MSRRTTLGRWRCSSPAAAGTRTRSPGEAVTLAENYGRQLANSVTAVLADTTPLKPTFAAVYHEISLPLAEIPTRGELVEESTDSNKYVAARAEMLLKKLASGEALPPAYPYPVQTWRLGGKLGVVILGGEVTVGYSVRLKEELDGPTFVMGYANDVMAYIPTLKVLKEGGYEGARSMIYYGLPSVWGPKIEELIVAEAHRQAKSLAAK